MTDKYPRNIKYHPFGSLFLQNPSKFMNTSFSGNFGQSRGNFGQFHLGKWFLVILACDHNVQSHGTLTIMISMIWTDFVYVCKESTFIINNTVMKLWISKIFDVFEPPNWLITNYYWNKWHENWSLYVSIILLTTNCRLFTSYY